ncbi:MAG TPA: BMP family protein [Chthonomonadaceae bacterium]|nr:BMP family protein [Chthonomonadaceae bacterium]
MRSCHFLRGMFYALLLAALACVIGCGRSSTPAGTQPAGTGAAAPAGSDFKVALVTSGPTSDNGWNAAAYTGLQEIKDQLVAQVANVEAPTSGEQADNLRQYAAKGYNIVIGHGAEYETPALQMESDFPKTLFVISSGRKVGKNTTPIVLQLEDGAYLLGMLAGGMSKTGKIGAVGAEKIVPLESTFKAYEAGAKAVNPNITVEPVYTGSWDDVGKAKQATLALIDQGADVVIEDLDAAAPGVFQAVQERNKADKPVYALGTNSDENGAAPDVVLASAPIDVGKAFVIIAQQVKAGTFKPNDKPFGMPSGVIGFVLNPQLEAKLPADLKAKLTDMQQKITSGAFTVPKVSS